MADGAPAGANARPAPRAAAARADRIRCDACPVLCYIREGRRGACDRYANEGGELVRVDPLTILREADPDRKVVQFLDPDREDEPWDGDPVQGGRVFVTAVGAGTTYPDYKPAPFIVSQRVDGADMVTVVTEGIFSYCGVKVKIDTDRHLGPERNLVRAEGEPVGHVTTGEYGSQMLSLGGVNHLTGGGKKEGRVTCDTLLRLCNREPVELSVDEGRDLVVQAGAAPIIDGVEEARMRVGCGSATIGMFARQWHGLVDEVVVVDDHITGVLSEHQAGKVLGAQPTGVRILGRRSTPGRYFQVAEPGTGWGGADIDDPLSILGPFNPKIARPGQSLLMVSTTGRAVGLLRAGRVPRAGAAGAARRPPGLRRAHRRELRAGALLRALHGRRGRIATRRRHREPRPLDPLRAADADAGDLRRRADLCLARRRHHRDGGRHPDAALELRLRADARPRRADRVHASPRRLRRSRRACG